MRYDGGCAQSHRAHTAATRNFNHCTCSGASRSWYQYNDPGGMNEGLAWLASADVNELIAQGSYACYTSARAAEPGLTAIPPDQESSIKPRRKTGKLIAASIMLLYITQFELIKLTNRDSTN